MNSPIESMNAPDLIGRRVRFKTGEDHKNCWHTEVGLITGKVVRISRSLAEKVQMLEEGGMPAPELREMEEPPRRIWVKADPCPSHKNGCEAAVEPACLSLEE